MGQRNSREWMASERGGGTKLIESKVLTASATSLTIAEIPYGFDEIVLMARLRSDRADALDNVLMRVGNTTLDTGSNYDYFRRREGTSAGNDQAASATSMVIGFATAATTAAGMFGYFEARIVGYSDTGRQREISVPISGHRSVSYRIGLGIGHWQNTTDPINILALLPETGTNFVAGSSASLIGVIWG